MQIAVFVCRNYGITLGEREDSDGFITRLQRFALAAFLRLEKDPLDVVRVQHQRVFCARCGGVFIRKYLQNRKAFSWKCQNAELKRHNTCFAENVKEATLQDVIVKAWNALVAERENNVNRWRRTVDEGNALQRYYAHMMISITADGPLEWEVPELTRLILEEMVVHSPWDFEVSFLDGSKVRVVARGFRNNLLMAECI